ncbi:MAG: response regulator transcription factor [Pseudomonadota bacterium]
MGITENDKHRYLVVLADDHEVFRAGTRDILQSIPDVEIVAEAGDGITTIKHVRKLQPDLLVLDSAMPMARGIEVFAEVRRWSPETSVVVLTGFTAPGFIADWLQAGVDGFLLKSCSVQDIRKGIETVLAGANYITPAASEILNNAVTPAPLTDREREVMAMVLAGRTNPEIAHRLSISVKTVDKHRGSLMSKLGVHSVAELMAFALREGLLDELKQL